MEPSIAEALKFTASQATAAVQKRTVFEKAAFEPAHHYMQHNPDGTAELVVSNPDWHREAFETPHSMVDYIKNNRAELAQAEVYITETGIVLIHDRTDRRHRSHCSLTVSTQYQWLRDHGEAGMTQRDAVRTLRVIFRGALAATGNLLTILRQIKFSSGTDGHADLQQGRESMGIAITRQVQGTDVLPDEFRLQIPMWDNYTHRVNLDVALEVDTETRTFAFTPFPQEMQRAMDAAIENLIGLFEADKEMPPVYEGSPG